MSTGLWISCADIASGPEVVVNDPNFTIESAKSFVAMWAHEDKATYGESKIGKIWDQYKNAAPYIFAVYRFFSFRLNRTKSIDEIVDWLEKFASNQQRLSRFIGRAAYASDILAGKARNVRHSDFRNIERLAPPIRPFTATELDIISSIVPSGSHCLTKQRTTHRWCCANCQFSRQPWD